MAYRLVIFDFDGTLADSADYFISMVNVVAEKFRFRKITDAEIEMLRGHSTREVVNYMRVPAWKMPFIARHTRKLVSENTSQIALFPGVEDLLSGLAGRGVCVALVSSNSEANVRKILGPAISNHIAIFSCGASIYGKTPKFKQVIKQAKVSPAEVISIGDETRDIEAATKAGIASGAVTWGYAEPHVLASHHPTLLFNEMGEILAAVAG